MEELLSAVEKRNWSELPSDLLYIIMDKLSSPQFLSDYIRFGAVCDSWNSVFCDHDLPSHQFRPLLLTKVPYPQYNDEKTTRRLPRFYNISEEKIDGCTLEVRMPHKRFCIGSNHGWLITVDNDHNQDADTAVRLFNPFVSTNGFEEILLPSIKTFPIQTGGRACGFVHKAVLSANPLTNPTDYTVMAIYGDPSRLAFFKPGNKRWRHIESPEIQGSKRGKYFTDVIYCHGKFFVVNGDGAVVAVSDDDVGGGGGGEEQGKCSMIAKLVIQPPTLLISDGDGIFKTKKYLIVESSGRELLKVHRFLDIISRNGVLDEKSTYKTTGFSVFKLLKVTGGGAKEEEEYKWQEVESLCGDSMFLSHETSISIRASDYPGCEPNSIRFTDDVDCCIRQDIGIFNLEDGSFKRYYAPKNNTATIWIQPSLPNKNRRSSSC